MKKLLLSVMIGTSMAFILTACVSPKVRQLERQNQAIYDRTQAEINPNPIKKYDIIIDASDSYEGLVLTDLKIYFTSKCRLFLSRIPMVTDVDKPLYYKTTIPFQQIGKQKYQATAYTDLLIDKDYFNQGKNCGWERPHIGFTFGLNANPDAKIINFVDVMRNQKTGELLAENEPFQGNFYFLRTHITNRNYYREDTQEIYASPSNTFREEYRNHIGKISITATPNFNKSDMNKKP